jgi:chemotaxis protein CheD
MSKLVTVDIADMQVSGERDAVLVTYALGSCIAVTVYDPVRHAGGMIHYMLPQAATSPEKAKTKPYMFADTGVPELFHAMYRLGSNKRDLVVKVMGGAAMTSGDMFEIGKRNHLILRKLLWKAGVAIAAEDVSGTVFRTAKLFNDTGVVRIKTEAAERDL